MHDTPAEAITQWSVSTGKDEPPTVESPIDFPQNVPTPTLLHQKSPAFLAFIIGILALGWTGGRHIDSAARHIDKLRLLYFTGPDTRLLYLALLVIARQICLISGASTSPAKSWEDCSLG